MSPDLIPFEELNEGFQKAQFQVESLLDSSKAVLSKNHYSVSIGLSILAFEECYKMQLFQHAIDDKKGIKKEDWEIIIKGDKKLRQSAHVVKSQKFYKDLKQYTRDRGEQSHFIVEDFMKKVDSEYEGRKYSDKIRERPEVIERLSTFSVIKNMCFYLDWKDQKWHFFENKSKTEKKAFAEFLIWLVEFLFCNRVANHHHPSIPNDKNSQGFQDYVNDPYHKRVRELEKMEKDKKFKITIMLARKIMDEFRKK